VQAKAANENRKGRVESSLDAAEATLANFKKRDEVVSRCLGLCKLQHNGSFESPLVDGKRVMPVI
jgi:hypothetical protein